MQTDSLFGLAQREYRLPAGARLTVRAWQADVMLHRLGAGATTHAYHVREGEELAFVSNIDSHWAVGPALGIVVITTEAKEEI
jgi:hypothetical protein